MALKQVPEDGDHNIHLPSVSYVQSLQGGLVARLVLCGAGVQNPGFIQAKSSHVSILNIQNTCVF